MSEVAVGGAAVPDVAVVASMYAAVLPVFSVKVAAAPVECAMMASGYVVHVDAVMPAAVSDGAEQPAMYAVAPVHEPLVVHEHEEPPKFVAMAVVATHAAVVCSEHDDWPEPVVVDPVAQSRQLPSAVYVEPPSE